MSQPGQHNSQFNSSTSGNVYATQGGGNINIRHSHTTPVKRGPRTDTKVLLIALPINVIYFFYGMLAYTGRNTTADNWRAGIFLFLFFATCTMIGRWIRRRI